MATNNDVNKIGEAPIGSIARYDFTTPANSGWLNCNAASVSKTTYSQLYSVAGNKYEGTGNLTQVNGLAGVISAGNYMTRWHPSSNYIAFGSEVSSKQVCIASFNGSTLTEVATVNFGRTVYGLDWHPNGNFLAFGGNTSNTVEVYSWNGTNTLTSVTNVNLGYAVYFVAWHPNGNYLAVSHLSGGTDEVKIFSWNGSNTLSAVAAGDLSGDGRNVAWSPNGNYLAIGNSQANNQLKIYSWNGSNSLTYICAYDYGSAGNIDTSLQWSPDGNFIALGGTNDTKQLVILSFDGSSLTSRATIDYGTSLFGFVRWSLGGNYLATDIGQTGSTVDTVFLYSWVPSTYTLTQVSVLQEVLKGSYSVDFNYTNNYLCWSGYSPTASPYNKLYAGTTGLTSNNYSTNFPLPNIANNLIRAK